MNPSNPPRNLVLYADDDPDDIEFVQESFRKFANNVELITFRNGMEILRYIQDHLEGPTPCLVMLDINMPVLDGKEALRLIRQLPQYDPIPVLLFTTSSQPLDREFAKKHGAGFITKPLDYNQMDRVVDQLIEHCSDEVKRRISKHFL